MSKTVGVLGGLGPEATLDFFSKILQKTPANNDQEHLRLIIDNNPKVPNRNEAIAGRGPSPGPALAAMARGLEQAGADFLVMVCNAAHAYQRDIEAAVNIPFVSIIEETMRVTLERQPKVRRVGVLAADACLEARLYQNAFAREDVEVCVPRGESQTNFMQLLYRIKSGDKSEEIRSCMRNLALELIRDGAEVIIAGCTEVPLVLHEGFLSYPLVSSTDVLVEATIVYARAKRALPGNN
jgi:aspartate racemase